MTLYLYVPANALPQCVHCAYRLVPCLFVPLSPSSLERLVGVQGVSFEPQAVLCVSSVKEALCVAGAEVAAQVVNLKDRGEGAELGHRVKGRVVEGVQGSSGWRGGSIKRFWRERGWVVVVVAWWYWSCAKQYKLGGARKGVEKHPDKRKKWASPSSSLALSKRAQPAPESLPFPCWLFSHGLFPSVEKVSGHRFGVPARAPGAGKEGEERAH